MASFHGTIHVWVDGKKEQVKVYVAPCQVVGREGLLCSRIRFTQGMGEIEKPRRLVDLSGLGEVVVFSAAIRN